MQVARAVRTIVGGGTATAIMVVALAHASDALASRTPTARERSGITQTAVMTEGSPTQTVRVSAIRVSSVGPWATATVGIYLHGQLEQEMAEKFYESHGDWIDLASANAPAVAMPLSVEQDLGLAATSNPLQTGLEIYLFACWFFGLAAIWDVLLQPSKAFREAGHSKRNWLLVEVLGATVVGVFTWAYYAARIRPAVVRAGGRRPRTLLKVFLGVIKAAAEGFASAVPNTRSEPPRGGSGQSDPFNSPSEPQSMPCGHCGARRGWWAPNPDSPGNQIWVTCPACGGKGSNP